MCENYERQHLELIGAMVDLRKGFQYVPRANEVSVWQKQVCGSGYVVQFRPAFSNCYSSLRPSEHDLVSFYHLFLLWFPSTFHTYSSFHTYNPRKLEAQMNSRFSKHRIPRKTSGSFAAPHTIRRQRRLFAKSRTKTRNVHDEPRYVLKAYSQSRLCQRRQQPFGPTAAPCGPETPGSPPRPPPSRAAGRSNCTRGGADVTSARGEWSAQGE
jgi:hypothetical protein